MTVSFLENMLMSTPEFERAALAERQDRLDAADARMVELARATERIHAELVRHVLLVMSNPSVTVQEVPYVRVSDGKKVTEPFTESLFDALAYDDIIAEVWAVLAGSTCSQIAALKLQIAHKIAGERAADLAELECREP